MKTNLHKSCWALYSTLCILIVVHVLAYNLLQVYSFLLNHKSIAWKKLKIKTMSEMVQNSYFICIFLSFPDKHIDFWTTVEDGNLSQTFFIIIIIIIWKYKYKIILSTSEMWETPIHFSLFYNRAWASHTRRPERCFQTSVRSVSSRGKKSVNIKKWASVRNGQGNQRGQGLRRKWETSVKNKTLHLKTPILTVPSPLSYTSSSGLHDTFCN